MSTSSKSARHDPLRPARRHWAVGVAAGVALALTIIWAGAARPDATELRVTRTGATLTARLSDGRHVILFANAESPTEGRAALGVLARPWEREPNVIVADARERVAGGLWETLQRTSPRQLIVLGAPGDSDDWLQIERHCRDTGIDIRFLATATTLELPSLTLSLIPSTDGNSHALISTASMRVAVELGGLPETGRFHALVAAGKPPNGVGADVMVAAESESAAARTVIEAEQGRRVTLRIDAERIGIEGGTVVQTPSS